MKNGRMQAKDVPDLPVLEFIHRVRTEGVIEPTSHEDDEDRWHHVTWFSYGEGFVPANSVRHAMPPGTPDKVVLAKMRRLIARGLVDGCSCGCRGDFELTDPGRALIGVEDVVPPEQSFDTFAASFQERLDRLFGHASTVQHREDAMRKALARTTPMNEADAFFVARRFARAPSVKLETVLAYGRTFGWNDLARISKRAGPRAAVALVTGISEWVSIGEVVLTQTELDKHLAAAGVTVRIVDVGIEIANGRIEIELPPWGGEIPGILSAGDFFKPLAPRERAAPSYLDHDPTKNTRRRKRKGNNRKLKVVRK